MKYGHVTRISKTKIINNDKTSGSLLSQLQSLSIDSRSFLCSVASRSTGRMLQTK